MTSSGLASGRAAQALKALILGNSLIGAYLVEFEENGEERAKYGAQMLSNLAGDPKAKGLMGLGVNALKDCPQFYRTYPGVR